LELTLRNEHDLRLYLQYLNENDLLFAFLGDIKVPQEHIVPFVHYYKESETPPENPPKERIPTREGTNYHKMWTSEEVSELISYIRENIPSEQIATRLGRTEKAIRSRANRLGYNYNPRTGFSISL
jgi:hypothetical protein